MMRPLIRKVLAVAVLSFVIAPLFAAEDPVFIRGVRPLGMGGAFVAVADDQNAMFYNPAGLTQRRGGQLTVFDLPINVADDIFNFYNFYNDNQDNFKDFDSLAPLKKAEIINDINDKMVTYKPRLRLGFPNTGYLSSGKGFLAWGLGLYTQADIGFQFNRSLILPSMSFWGNVDAAGLVPLAHRFNSLPYSIPGKLSVGTTLKYLNRARIAEYNQSLLTFESMDPLLQMGQGMGADIGLLYQPADTWNVGLQVSDFGGTPIKFVEAKSDKTNDVRPATVGVIYPRWNVGAAFIPSKIYYWPGKSIGTRSRLTLAVDVRDFASADESVISDSFWKKLHMGAELRWMMFAFRGGFNSGYPSFGVGLNLFLLNLDYAFWGDEMGRFAGQQAEYNHQVNLTMRFGQNKGRAWGRATLPKKEKAAKNTEETVPDAEQKAGQPAAVEAAPEAAAAQEAAPEAAAAETIAE